MPILQVVQFLVVAKPAQVKNQTAFFLIHSRRPNDHRLDETLLLIFNGNPAWL